MSLKLEVFLITWLLMSPYKNYDFFALISRTFYEHFRAVFLLSCLCSMMHNCTLHSRQKSLKNMKYVIEKNVLLILTNPSYLDKPFLPWQALRTFTDPSYFDKHCIPWQTLHTLTVPSYLDKSFIIWQTLHTLTNPSYFDRPFIPWQILHTLTNPSIPLKPIHTFKNHSYIDNPFLSWQSILLRVCPQKQFAPSILCVRKWDIFS